MQTKTCRMCKITKNISEFYFRKDISNYLATCKECNNLKKKKYNYIHINYRLKKHKKYYF